ncbi:aminoglycoside phosphotransferase family protein [Microlunatus elymi]|uniref:Aminoglycoside phosphotransferase family protein n=1 Tax=Microlunatus elymi TaxID=2596828 RepID=A0A516PTV2_9ACTN|nr:aminoglycoside phosphotransferase family protein [Microlunatus elymi]QDP94626.1 aminoglycoside phosphotransferase family protein [Microlunatus elymi]
MELSHSRRAVTAAMSTGSALGLAVDDAVVLNDSNRMVVRLTPCDTVARVTPTTHYAGHWMSPEREVEIVAGLGQTDSPVAQLDPRVEPRVQVRDGFAITFWTYFEPMQSRVPPADYTRALERLHVGLRQLGVTTPHITDRVTAVQQDVANRDVTPELTDADRAFLASTLGDLTLSITDRRAPEQLLHGEPHPGNVLVTRDGPLFIDFENTARGPVEYDLGWLPIRVSDRYTQADQQLVDGCRGLVLSMVAAYRWRRGDRHPSGRESGTAFLNALRAGPPWPALDDVTW